MQQWSTLKKLIWLRAVMLKAASWVIEKITGSLPLTITNAVQHAIQKLTRYGLCTQPSGTWNTAITQEGKCEQRNLPQGYTELEYIGSDSTAYIDTGVAGASDLECSATFSYGTFQAYGRIWSNYAGDNYNSCRFILGVTTGAAICNCNTKSFTDGNINVSSGVTANDIHTATVYPGGTRAVVDGNEYTKSSPATGLGNTNTIWLLTQPSVTPRNIGAKIYLFTVKKGGVLIRDMRPAKRNSDNAIGMYDLVTQMFFEKQGTGTFTAGSSVTPTPSTPVDIVCNNGALRYGKPLTVDSTRTTAYINSNGVWAYSDDSYSVVVPVVVGKKYKIAFDATGQQTTIDDIPYPNVIFRYGFTDDIAVYDHTIQLSQWARSTPQDTPSVEVMADKSYLIIQTGSSVSSALWNNGYLGVKLQEVYEDGTPEVLTVRGKNLFDFAGSTYDKFLNSQGVEQPGVFARFSNAYTDYLPVEPNTVYTLSLKRVVNVESNHRIHGYTEGKSWINQVGNLAYATASVGEKVSTTFTTPANCHWLRINYLYSPAGETPQLELGSTATAYEPYVTPQTASVPMLLGVGDYKDTAELISGIKTGKVGIKVLDGTENWTNISGYYNISKTDLNTNSTVLPQNSTSIICTHFATKTGLFTDGVGVGGSYVNFKYDTIAATLNAWKAWLAAEYAAGTPVIVLYPLATETTEQMTAYPQLCNKLYNTADVVANVSDISVTFTTGEQTVPSPYSQLPIMCNNGELKWNGTAVGADGTPETLTVSGINLLDPSTSNIIIGQYYSANGTTVNGVNNWRTGLIPIIGGKTYAFYGRKKSDNTMSAYNRINWFDANGANISPRPSYTVNTVTVGTAPSNAAFVGLSCSCYDSNDAITRDTLDEFNWMFAEASAEIPYEPYVTPQTASVPMLLGVGDYKDEAELIGGLLTHKVGVKVFDGTESWTKGTLPSSNYYYGVDTALDSNAENELICNQFAVGTRNVPAIGKICIRVTRNGFLIAPNNQTLDTVEKFKQFLAAQFAAGTPVIVLYPLAIETTEYVTPQPLNATEGTNIIDSTSNVSPVDVEIEYAAKKGA